MIYVTGDMHGNEGRLYDAEWRKLKKDDYLIVCGDFGFLWDGSKREQEALKYLGSRKFTILFLDGTHENFDLLNKCRESFWKGGYVRRVSGNLLNLKRGQIYNIDGTKIFTFGGGESPEREIRQEVGGFWPQQLPTPSEYKEGAQNLDEAGLEVDYILTHEPPQLIASAMQLRRGGEQKVTGLGGYLQEVANTCKYKHWYFGSMHEDRNLTPKFSCVFNKNVPLTSNGEDLR